VVAPFNLMSNQLLIIGLDGGTYDLLQPLIAQGEMPHLAGFLQAGSWGRLASTVPPFTAAAWSSFATGHNPGMHGILSFQRADRYHHYERNKGFNDARQLKRPIWQYLSDNGRRVAVVNVPLSYPPQPVNGIMITGMMTPPGQPFTFPRALADKLGDYHIDVDFIRAKGEFAQYAFPEKTVMLDEIEASTRSRTAVCRQLLAREKWDLFMVVYTGTDRINHFFWDELQHLRDPQANGTPDPLLPRLREYFRALDRDIGALMAQVGPQAHLLLMSDHGFGKSPTRRFAVNIWLEKLGLLNPRQGENWFSLGYWRMKVGRNPWLKKAARRLLSQRMQDQLSRQADDAAGGSLIDWERTSAYSVPIYFSVCGIGINRADEQAQGLVASGAAYEALRDRIIAAAQQVRDPENGRRIVLEAQRREELFHGPHVPEFPDIILILDPDYVGGKSVAGKQLVEPEVPFRSGEHRADGIFAAFGPHIRPTADLPGLQLTDVTATAYYLLGVPVPDDLDGRVLAEIIDPARWAQAPPQYATVPLSAATTAGDAAASYSDDQEAAVEERLRSLGYLE
jgi:predicted AlkP superfamily phosphohydrolase/phosphomutase